ncbi:condensation domain-containing protein [Winogradskyella sp. R77965]|uniref:condensation domain-containing protein n=1 Tax=Winogradskyella sp. R77965 TaxID=3093872 RepID=UPI0037DDA384
MKLNPLIFLISSDISDADLYIKAQVNSIQKNFELSKANLFKCIYFKAAEPKDSIIIFIAHHLLVDAVSWQIIINDFRALINDHGTDNKSLLDKSTSLNKWGEYLNEYANSDKLKQEIDFWANQINEKPNLPVDLDFDKPILENSIEILHFTLDKNKTSELLKKANKEFKTKIDELLVGALTLTLSEWSKADIINLGMERHGRETQDIPELDLSNSVGWFTSYFPVKLQLETQDLSSHIKSIKEQLRQIPNKGIGYGVLKYKSSDIEIDGIANYSPEVLFNYLGVNHQIKDTEDLMVATAIEDIPLRSNKSERDYLFEINTFVQNDILHINWSYSKDVHHPKTISNLTTSFKTKLEKIINHCLNNNDETYTPSDFPDVDLNQDDLNNLLDSL